MIEPKFTLSEATGLEHSLELLKDFNELYLAAKIVEISDVVIETNLTDLQLAQDAAEMIRDKLKPLAEAFGHPAVMSAYAKVIMEIDDSQQAHRVVAIAVENNPIVEQGIGNDE